MKAPSSSWVLPTPAQETILDIVLKPEAEALAALASWKQSVDPRIAFDWRIARLMPLVYDRLRALGVEDPLMSRLKSAYFTALYETQRILAVVPTVLAPLAAVGIPTMMIKGTPLAVGFYRSPALRPMRDFDLLVPEDRAAQAVAVLEQAGWVAVEPISREDFRYRHSVPMRNGAGLEMDLHWQCLFEDGSQVANHWFWSRSRPLAVGSSQTLQPDATGLLLHSVLHGLRANFEPPFRWVPDACRIIASPQGIAWDELVGFARSRKLTHRLGLGLEYLARRYDAAVPAPVLEELRSIRPSLMERLENTYFLGDIETMISNPVGRRWIDFVEYARVLRIRPLRQVIAELPNYMRHRARLERKRDLLAYPFHVVRRSAQRLLAGRPQDQAR